MRPKIDAIGAFLASRDWIDRVVPAAELASVGQAPHHGLAFAVSLKSDDEPNPFGVRGRSYEAKPAAGKATHLNCGQHGGLARYEQMPFLMIDGAGFTAGCGLIRANLAHRHRADHPGSPAAAGRRHGRAQPARVDRPAVLDATCTPACALRRYQPPLTSARRPSR